LQAAESKRARETRVWRVVVVACCSVNMLPAEWWVSLRAAGLPRPAYGRLLDLSQRLVMQQMLFC
jgi:hypothetical protein